MAVHLNHHIIHAKDPVASANHLSEILGLPAPTRFGPFHIVEAENGVSLDYMHTDGEVNVGHYAFLVSEEEFDQIFGRIQAAGIDYFADPGAQHKGEINHHDGGRGIYWADPEGQWLEIITRPYGSGEATVED